jgi:hypothetical protein
MDVSEVVDRKSIAEAEISRIIFDLQKKTGCLLTDIKITKEEGFGVVGVITSVNITLVIE